MTALWGPGADGHIHPCAGRFPVELCPHVLWWVHVCVWGVRGDPVCVALDGIPGAGPCTAALSPAGTAESSKLPDPGGFPPLWAPQSRTWHRSPPRWLIRFLSHRSPGDAAGTCWINQRGRAHPSDGDEAPLSTRRAGTAPVLCPSLCLCRELQPLPCPAQLIQHRLEPGFGFLFPPVCSSRSPAQPQAPAPHGCRVPGMPMRLQRLCWMQAAGSGGSRELCWGCCPVPETDGEGRRRPEPRG